MDQTCAGTPAEALHELTHSCASPVPVASRFQHRGPRTYCPDDATRRRAWRTTGLPREVPGERGLPNDPWLDVDSDSAGFDPRLDRSRADVATAADSGDLQIALVVVVCDATVADRKNQRSTFRDCVGIPCDRSELPVGDSLGAVVWNLIGLASWWSEVVTESQS